MATIPMIEVNPTSGALGAPRYVDARVLAANTAETVTVPSLGSTSTKAGYVLFSANADFYVNYLGTAAVPAADVTDGTAAELNPTLRYVANVGDFSIISPSACVVTMAFFG